MLLRAARAGGVNCPECGTAVPINAAVREMRSVLACPGCGRRASITELTVRGKSWGREEEDDEPRVPARPVKPEGSRIVVRELKNGGQAWEIPRSGKGGFILAFAVLWLLFTGPFGVMMVWQAVSGGEFEPGSLMIMPFVLVGLVLLYFGLRAKYADHLVIVDRDSVILGRSLFGRRTLKSLPRKSVSSVEKSVFYRQNYQPVHGIEIRASRGKLRFGSSLDDPEKSWLVAELREALGVEGQTGQTARAPEPAGPAGRVESRFTVVVPTPARRAALGGSLILLAIGLGFVALGIFVMDDAGFFRILWIGMSAFFALVGLVALVLAIRSNGVVTEVVGMPGQVLMRRRRGRRVLSELSLPRGEVVAVRLFKTGAVNDQPAHALEVVGAHEALPLAYYNAAPALPGFARELAGRLGVGL